MKREVYLNLENYPSVPKEILDVSERFLERYYVYKSCFGEQKPIERSGRLRCAYVDKSYGSCLACTVQ